MHQRSVSQRGTSLQLRADIHAAHGPTPAPLNFCRASDAVELLVQHGAQVNEATSQFKWPPLHTMASNGGVPLQALAKLLELRADLNGFHGQLGGSPPLGFLAHAGNSNAELIELARLLLDKKADINRVYQTEGIWQVHFFSKDPPAIVRLFSNMTTTLLGFCAMFGCEDLAVLLLQATADPEIRNSRGPVLRRITSTPRTGSKAKNSDFRALQSAGIVAEV